MHVAVAALAERVGERLDLLQRGAEAPLRKAGLEDLQRRPQAPGGDPHVVDALDVADVEHALGRVGELARAHRDHLRGRGANGSSSPSSGIGRAFAIRVQPKRRRRLGRQGRRARRWRRR